MQDRLGFGRSIFVTANNVHWTYDAYALSNGTGKAVVKQGKRIGTLLLLYALGAALEKDATSVVTANGGKVLGTNRSPLSDTCLAQHLDPKNAHR